MEIDTRPVDIKDEDRMALDEEPVINSGVAGALELAKKKGQFAMLRLKCYPNIGVFRFWCRCIFMFFGVFFQRINTARAQTHTRAHTYAHARMRAQCKYSSFFK